MKDDVQTRGSYHHGNLPQALISTAADLLSEKAAEGFSMREVARRAGVAVAAPSHHFGNAKGLLTAVAICAFQRLTEEQTASMARADSPLEKVISLTRTYIDMSERYPGYAAVLFRWDLVDHDDEDYVKASSASFDLLQGAVAEAAPEHTEAGHILNASKAIWAMAHGFVTLSLTDGPEGEARIRFAVKTLLDGMRYNQD